MTKKKQLPQAQKVGKNKYRIQFDFEYGGDPGKTMDGTVVTQPDMSLTVRQLLENHTRGVDSNVQERKPIYFDVPVPTITDITDVHEYRAHLKEKLMQTDTFIKQEQAEAKEDTLKEEKAAKALKSKLAKERRANKQLDLEEQIKQQQ